MGPVDEAPAGTSSFRTVLAPLVVARGAELAELGRALDAATCGRGSVLFVVGEAGIGKTRLTHAAAADAASRNMLVLRGRAVQAPTPSAYRPLAEAICQSVRAGTAPSADELGPYRPLLGRLVPEWRTADRAAATEEPVVAVAEAVLRFLRALARDRGCLLVLEDLHWGDPETLGICQYLADNISGESVLCLATVRDDGPSPGLDLARELHARRVASVVQPSRLARDDVATMVRACLDAEVVDERVVDFAARADGIPFLVEELLATALTSGALVAEGRTWRLSAPDTPLVPLTFAEGIRRRLAALGEDTTEVLHAAAVLGRRFDWTLVPGITGQAERDVLAALGTAVDAQILAIDVRDPTFRFRHALTRDAVLADLLPPQAASLCRRALRTLEAAHPTLDDDAHELAVQLAEGAGEPEHAARLLLEAGRRALAKGALASAEAMLERARRLPALGAATSVDVDDCLSEVLALAGKRDRALEVGAGLLATLRDAPGAAPRRAELSLRLARAALAATRWDEARGLVEQARAELRAAPDERMAAYVGAVAAQAAIMRDPSAAAALAADALDAAERLDLPDVACESLEILGRSRRHHDLEAAESCFTRALQVAEAHDLALWRARAIHELGTLDMLRGAGVARLDHARELALAQGALATAAVVDVQIAAALVFSDDPGPAAVSTRRAVDVARRYGLHQTLAVAVALEAYVHARAGDRTTMERCVEEARAYAGGVPDVEVKLSAAAAVLAFVEEDRGAARRHLEEAVRPALAGPGGDYASSPAGGMLALLDALDRRPSDVHPPDGRPAAVHFVARAFQRYAGAVVAGRAGDAATAARLMDEASALLGVHHWLRHLAHRLVAEAAVADGWGDPVSWLREALAVFDERGERDLASACRSLLRRAGAPVPRRRGDDPVPAGLAALGVTTREVEVLRLLALGLPNKEIGARLYLSPRTVERHVANLSVKTGVSRRSELVAYAARRLAETPAP